VNPLLFVVINIRIFRYITIRLFRIAMIKLHPLITGLFWAVVVGFGLDVQGQAQTTCEDCSIQFNVENLPDVEMSCSDGNPLQNVPNFPAFTSTCSAYWTSLVKYTTGSYDECIGSAPASLPAELGSIQLSDLTASGIVTSNKFFETGEGLTWTVYTENIARLHGTIANANNVSALFEVDFYFDQSTSGQSWVDGGGNVNSTTATTEQVENWTIWQLKPYLSKLVGTGSLDGHVLYLENSSYVFSYPFQEGVAANGMNTNLGLGGSFDWLACVAEQTTGGTASLHWTWRPALPFSLLALQTTTPWPPTSWGT